MKKLEKKEMKSIQGGLSCWSKPTLTGSYNCDNGMNCYLNFTPYGTYAKKCDPGWLY
jgi:bacteriocin-like protein